MLARTLIARGKLGPPQHRGWGRSRLGSVPAGPPAALLASDGRTRTVSAPPSSRVR